MILVLLVPTRAYNVCNLALLRLHWHPRCNHHRPLTSNLSGQRMERQVTPRRHHKQSFKRPLFNMIPNINRLGRRHHKFYVYRPLHINHAPCSASFVQVTRCPSSFLKYPHNAQPCLEPVNGGSFCSSVCSFPCLRQGVE